MLVETVLTAIAGLVTTEKVLHVAVVGDDAYAGTKDQPFRTIAKAIAVAAPQTASRHVRIQLLGNDPFDEAVTLPKNVTLAGPGTLVAPSGGPAVRVIGTLVDPITDVVLRDLTLRGSGAGYQGDGGAVEVVAAERLTLRDCVIEDSHAVRGGGLSIYLSSDVLVERCTVRGNVAEHPTIDPLDLDVDLAGLTPSLEIGGLPRGRGHGGGVWVSDSSATLRACDIDGNRALVAGGGVAVTNEIRLGSAVLIDDCAITRNQVSHTPFAAGSIRYEAAAPTEVPDRIREGFKHTALWEGAEVKALSNAHGMNYESGHGGGISLHHTRQGTTIIRCRIGMTRAGTAAPNLARRGGGVHLYTGSYPAIRDSIIAFNAASDDGGGFGCDFFDPFQPAVDPVLGLAREPMVPRAPIVVERTTFLENTAVQDGGGAYLTGNAMPRITDCVFQGNEAGEHGGGLRATYASDVQVTGVRFEQNVANTVLLNPDPEDGDAEGGGGISIRNSDLLAIQCTFVRNRANAFAGGAIYYRSSFEGEVGWNVVNGFALKVEIGLVSDEHGFFDRIQEADFGYRRRQLRIVDCIGLDNRAEGIRGAGGFLYALRSPGVVGAKVHGGDEPMWVSIEGPRTHVAGNVSEAIRAAPAGTRKRGNVVIEVSGRMLPGGEPADRVSIAREVAPAAIGQTTPAPDGRALAVMPDSSQAHDVRRETEGGGAYVLGPAPTVTLIDEPVGPAAGGTIIRASGAGFVAPMRVHVGGVAAAVGAETATTIDFTLPALPPGLHDVAVSYESGAQAASVPRVKVVPPPTVTSFLPVDGRAGDTVELRGNGLPLGTTVDFVFGAGTSVSATVAQLVDDKLAVTVPVPPAIFTAAAIRVTTPIGQTTSTPPLAFRYR